MRKPIFGDDQEEDQQPVKEYLTEYTSTSTRQDDTKADTLPIIPRLENAAVLRTNTKKAVDDVDASSIVKKEPESEAFGLILANTSTRHAKKSNEDSQNHAESESEPSILTAEERAMQELVDPVEVKVEHTIESIGGNDVSTEVAQYPDMSLPEDYEAIPVESFGLALLRGYGYESPKVDTEVKLKKKLPRPDFLGFGATARPEETKSAKELATKKFEQRQLDRHFEPVTKINKRTGEVVTDDAKSKASNQKHQDRVMPPEPSPRSTRHRSSSRSPDRRSSSRRHDKSDSRYKESRSRSSRYEEDRRRHRRERSRSPRRDSDRHRSRTHRDR